MANDKDITKIPLGLLFKDWERVMRECMTAFDRYSELDWKHHSERPRCAVAWRSWIDGKEYTNEPESLSVLRRHPDYQLDRAGTLRAYRDWRRKLAAFERETGIAQARQEWEQCRARRDRIEDAIAAIPIRSRQDATIKARFLNEYMKASAPMPWGVVWSQLHEWLTA